MEIYLKGYGENYGGVSSQSPQLEISTEGGEGERWCRKKRPKEKKNKKKAKSSSQEDSSPVRSTGSLDNTESLKHPRKSKSFRKLPNLLLGKSRKKQGVASMEKTPPPTPAWTEETLPTPTVASDSTAKVVDDKEETAVLLCKHRWEVAQDQRDAYRIVCLGVTEEDWRFWLLVAFEVSYLPLNTHWMWRVDLEVAKKSFLRLRDLKVTWRIHSIEAFGLVRKHPQIAGCVSPIATWLIENDRFDEAQEVIPNRWYQTLTRAGREEEALHLLEELAENCRF
ncbi:Intraflagellar transport protein 122 homolog [Geodia barretti]|uniref:Intraflagellar transport protein 122 homolog n=1 Tax=Geodia barretti TaxID=519541 RepID=A0AA35XLX2_GEOBA|nr:Intraflagellar transport protein 122 homolog [Geodia barretti]